MEDFDLEAEYQKYKAAQRAHIVKPEWQRLAEEDLKDLLTKPEFKVNPNLLNWLYSKIPCSFCGKLISNVASYKHIETCESNSKIIFDLLKEEPHITISEISRRTGFSRSAVGEIFKNNKLTHKFSDPRDYNKHENHRTKFLEGAKKGGETQGAKEKLESEKKYKKLWNLLPEDSMTITHIKKIIKKNELPVGHRFLDKFIKSDWIIKIHHGKDFSSTNPHLYIKNPAKADS